MAIKKNDRVQIAVGGTVYHGFISKGGAEATMILDNGKQQIRKLSSFFSPSSEPVPDDSPFKGIVLERGARVDCRKEDGSIVKGRVKSADIFRAVVQHGLDEYNVPQKALKRSAGPDPVDPPSPMDAWSVRDYKLHDELSRGTIAFSASIYLDGQKVLDAKNDGNGGCNIYYGRFELQSRLADDAKAWANSFGDAGDFEPDAGWVHWCGGEKPVGITATEHFEADREAMAAYAAPRM